MNQEPPIKKGGATVATPALSVIEKRDETTSNPANIKHSAAGECCHLAPLPPQRPLRVQLSRRKGWRMPENTVKVGRPGKWGNPYKEDRTEGGKDRAWAVSAFRAHYHNDQEYRALVVRALRGKNLACWCPLDGGPCHADVLLDWANKTASFSGGPRHEARSSSP